MLTLNNLTSLIIPNSVTSVGHFAFYGNQLKSLTISLKTTSIGSNAFSYNELPDVTIPNSVTSIGSNAFYGNVFSSIQLPSPTVEGYTIDGWLSSNNDHYDKGAITSDLYTTSYSLKAIDINTALVEVLFEGFTGSLAVTGDVVMNENDLDSFSFQVEKASSLVLTPKASSLTKGYELSPKKVSLNDIQENVNQIFSVTPTDYTIRYNNVDDVTGYVSTYTIEDAPTFLPIPTKDGYTFEGWYKEESLFIITNIPTGSAENYLLFAKWSQIVSGFTTNNNLKKPTLYPNPSSGIFTLELGTLNAQTISVYTSTGQLLSERTVNSDKVGFDLKQPTGIYLVKVQTLEGAEVLKISIK